MTLKSLSSFLLLTMAGAVTGNIVTPSLISGLEGLDPAGGRNDLNLNATGPGAISFSNKSLLTQLPGYASIQSWTGLTISGGGTTTLDNTSTNTFSFSDRPDVTFTFVGESGRNAGSGAGGAAAYTSGSASPAGSESLFFGTNSKNLLTITFGTLNGATFTADQGVQAVGFTFSRNTAATNPTTWVATFYDGSTELSSQTVDAGTAMNVSALFGYVAQGTERITHVVLGAATGASYDNKNHFVDDFGFTAVPEPSTYGIIMGALGLALVFYRRRR